MLIHVGIDTVKLNGEGFSSKFKNEDTFKKGDVLLEFDKEKIVDKGYDAVTPIIITNSDKFDKVECIQKGSINAGQLIMTLKCD